MGFDDVYMSRDGKYLIAIKKQNLTVYDIMGNYLVSVNSEWISSDDGLDYLCAMNRCFQKVDITCVMGRSGSKIFILMLKKIIEANYDIDIEF